MTTTATIRLARLDRPHRIEPYQATDEELVCANCGVAIVPLRGDWLPGSWQHDPEEVATIRRMAEPVVP